DIIGIAMIIFAPLLYLIYFTGNNSGFVGSCFNLSLNALFGWGKYLFPIYLIYFGLYLIFLNSHIFSKEINTLNFFKTKSLVGITVAFLSVTGIFGSVNLENALTGEIHILNSFGGLVGFSIAYLTEKLFGSLNYTVLSAIIIICIILTVNFNLSLILNRKKDLQEKQEKQKKPKPLPVRPKHKAVAEIIPAEKKPERDNFLDIINRKKENKPKKKQETKPDKNTEFTFSTINKNTDFRLPPTNILNSPVAKTEKNSSENYDNIRIIENTLKNFNIDAEVLNVSDGPTVSRYEVKLAEGIRVQKIINLADNLAMSLAAIDVRVEAPIPGKSAIGVEVPKASPSMVTLREILEDPAFQKAKGQLTFAIGKDVAAKAVFADLTKMPHLLIGGSTGSGKSVGLNTLIVSLLYRLSPDELKFVMIDPKRVELSLYDGIPHLACPVIKDAKLAAGALNSVVSEMDRRYRILEQASSRNIATYNAKAKKEDRLCYMVVVIDELADLMMQCAKEVEDYICRIAQLSRAVGIHLVIATQRPSVDVITGKIKTNIASRIAFAVANHHDSITIIDRAGAERLIGRGDMLFSPITDNKPQRVQGCFLSEDEILSLVDYLKSQQETNYDFIPQPVSAENTSQSGMPDDDLWNDVLRFVVRNEYCSTSILQRHFKIGYNRAGTLVDMMEEKGIVGPLNGAKPRNVLITENDLPNYLNGDLFNE
ncbi:MAG: DNA translocase FtsK 4TM domain-containing protein, partial [Armatimonadetes bacterium]|nr:DNA translocase FtsK 4TM domain-containing protein [Candidatus Hippobium faecium]